MEFFNLDMGNEMTSSVNALKRRNAGPKANGSWACNPVQAKPREQMGAVERFFNDLFTW